jgi:membrane fusion protein (multidrug efflux system)
VDVDENQVVKAGDVIAELDPSGLPGRGGERRGRAGQRAGQRRGGQRECAHHHGQHRQQSDSAGRRCERLARRRGAGEQQLEAAHARVAQAQANYTKAQADLERYKPLVEKDVISKQQFDAAVAAADAPRPRLADARRRAGRRRRRRRWREREAQAQAG